jgi:hypothetical protein
MIQSKASCKTVKDYPYSVGGSRSATSHRVTVTLIYAFVLILLPSCGIPLKKENLKTSVLAKDVGNISQLGLAPVGITDVFNLEGNVYIYATFTWPDGDTAAGKHDYTFRWYTGDRLEAKVSNTHIFGRPPVFMLGHIPTAVLGVGTHAVELYVDDQFVVRKEFEVRSQ